MTPDNCPLCGTSVALLRRPDYRPETEVQRARITTLRARADAIERGELTPRQIQAAALWMCAPCQRLMVGLAARDAQEIQRRIHDEVRRLNRRAS